MVIRNIVISLALNMGVMLAGADEVNSTTTIAPTQRHLTELLAYFDEPRLMRDVVVVGWFCDGWGAFASEIDNNAWVGFRPGLFLTREDCSPEGVQGIELNYSNGIELKIEHGDAEVIRNLVGQLVTLRGDYFSWHNVISMESSFKSGVLQVKVMAAGNQRFQGAFGPIKEKE